MADISRVQALINGYPRGVDLPQNSLVVGSLKVGASSPEELTKAILAKLILVQAAADADGTFDSRYAQLADLISTANGEGASLIAIEDAGGYYTGGTVEAALQELGTLIGAGDAANITFDPTGTSFSATDVQALGEEIDDRIVATEVVANAAIPLAQKGANNGVATLDAGGKVPIAQLPSSVMTYEGTWDASTNTPSLANGSGDAGMIYLVSVAGSTDFGAGPIAFEVGDWAVYNGSIWQKSLNSNAVVSVNGMTGVVSLTTTDIPEGTNLYFTDAAAQAATISQVITNGVTTKAPSEDAVFDALALKQDASAALDEAETFFGATDITGAEAEQLTAAGNADSLHSHATLKETRNAGETLAINTLWALRFAKSADAGFAAGRMYKADNDATTVDNFQVVGIARPTSGVTAGNPVEFVKRGPITATAHGFTVGAPLFLGASGVITETAPTANNAAVLQVGMVIDANTIEVIIGSATVI